MIVIVKRFMIVIVRRSKTVIVRRSKTVIVRRSMIVIVRRSMIVIVRRSMNVIVRRFMIFTGVWKRVLIFSNAWLRRKKLLVAALMVLIKAFTWVITELWRIALYRGNRHVITCCGSSTWWIVTQDVITWFGCNEKGTLDSIFQQRSKKTFRRTRNFLSLV